MNRIILISILLLLGACSTVSNKPSLPQNGTIATDLQSAAYNLDQAIAIGVLPKDDPAAGCVHQVIADAGLDGKQETQSFEVKRDGLISEGALIYIRVQQAKALRDAGITLPVDCEALVGRLVIDAMKIAGKAGRSLIPGGNLIGVLR